MPSTIPYDPRLMLGNLVDQAALNNVEKIAESQGVVDSAEMTLNSLISSRRSLDMTKSELANLGIGTEECDAELTTLNKQIREAGIAFAKAKIAAEAQIQPLRAEMMKSVHSGQESPLDYVKSQIKTLPLGADSINMNVQYFSYDSNRQTSETFSRQISSFVSNASKFLGTGLQSQASDAAAKQANSQASNHELQGTLVLSVSCTHKNASMFAPFVLNVDKAVKVWNATMPGKKFDPTRPSDILKIARAGEMEKEKLTIISGTTFGSTFVGMVHILKSSSTTASEILATRATSLQQQMEAGAWFSSQSGGFGVNSSFANNVKNLLSTQSISSHVTMLCMGVIPSMVASNVQLAVEKFATFDPKGSMDTIATIQNSVLADLDSVKASADAARTGGSMVAMKSGEIKASLTALAEIDDGSNKILDINSMMTAFDDYLKKAAEGRSGVPINYYLKDINRQMIAEMWVAKYFPGRFLPIISDDSAAVASSGQYKQE